MPTVTNIFTNGRMDSDTDHSLADNKGYRYALNLRPSGYGKDGTMTPIRGSEKIADYSENGSMTVIGMFAGSDNKLYHFLSRCDGFSRIVETDIITEQSKIVIEDSNYLRFDLLRWEDNVETKKKYLLSVDQINNLLFFSSDEWEYPRVIDLKRDYSAGITQDDIFLAKKPPLFAPEIVEKKDNEYDNDDNDTFVSFAYRYKYVDGDYSALSFYSDTAFEPDTTSPLKINVQRENTGMVNKWDYIRLSINSGDKNVTDIEVYAREHGSNTAYLIHSVNKERSSVANNTFITNIEYKFSKNYEVLSEEDTLMLYSNVPKYPKTQTVAGNRLLFANYHEGYDLSEDVDYTVRNITSIPTQSSDRRTAVSLFKYKVGIVYFNDYNESTSVLLPLNQTKSEIEVGFDNRLLKNKLQVALTSQPPAFATKMKFVVNSQELNYEILYITYARKIGKKVYLLLSGDNVNRLKQGDTITQKDVRATEKKSYKIIELKQYDIDDGLPLKGTYAMFEIDDSVDLELKSNGNTVTKNHHITEKQIDAVRGSTNTRRYDATSGYEGYGMSGVYYTSKWNRGTLFKTDYGAIKEGDVLNINIDFSYGRDKKGGSSDSTDWYGHVFMNEELYASSDYPSVYEFLLGNLVNPYLTVKQNGNEVWLMTNSFYPDLVRNKVPGIWDWEVNDSGREERAVVDVKTKIKLQRGITPIIFRTENKETLNNFFFETPKTYPIVNGKVIPDDHDGATPLFDIGFYNGYVWGNGIESYKIKDAFNAKSLQYRFRPNLYDKKGYKRIHRKNDISYSGAYNYELGINQLSTFNLTLANWKTLPVHYGEIQHIVSTDGDISVFCTDKVINQMYGKAIIYDLQGNENIATTKEVLGDYQVLPYTFGTQHPESVVKSVDGIYFVDKKRTRYLFKNGNQIIELNPEGSGHHSEGVKEIKYSNHFLGSYNEAHGEWVCGLDHKKAVVFNPQAKGFSHYYNFSFEYLQAMNGMHFTAQKGAVYTDEVTDDYNVFAGYQYREAKIIYTVNTEMNTDKIFQAMMLHSDVAWDVNLRTNLTATDFSEYRFDKRESFYYAEIQRDSATVNSASGVGTIQSVNGNVLSYKNAVTNQVSVGDTLSNQDGISSVITDIDGKSITVSDASNFNIGDFTAALKKQEGSFRPNGVPIRGKWMEVTLTKNSNACYYLTSVNTEILKSNH